MERALIGGQQDIGSRVEAHVKRRLFEEATFGIPDRTKDRLGMMIKIPAGRCRT
jgi:hypothetical protein